MPPRARWVEWWLASWCPEVIYQPERLGWDAEINSYR